MKLMAGKWLQMTKSSKLQMPPVQILPELGSIDFATIIGGPLDARV
jgi:hypothetical protein